MRDAHGNWRLCCDASSFHAERRAAQGLSSGVHVVISAARWPDIRAALLDLIETRLELRLATLAELRAFRAASSTV